ncbi:MAG: radical SAM protein [Candidatus Dojkabacteria bacterium]
MDVLLVEPAYKNKYPPLGLMKISTYHKSLGDSVRFAKGTPDWATERRWDKIYISTIFSFDFDLVVRTIKRYQLLCPDIVVGGVMVTTLGDEVEALGVKIHRGLWPEVDGLVPDRSVLGDVTYDCQSIISYATRGCPNRCKFCVVHKHEPEYQSHVPFKDQVRQEIEQFGDRKELILLDNNILASPDFEQIIEDIHEIGFYKGATIKLPRKPEQKRNRRHNRVVDFNQGLDCRLLTPHKAKLLATLPLKPFRLSFDHLGLKDQYVKAIEIAANAGFKYFSNYVLYNFNDSPEELYERFKISIELNDRLGVEIFSFPMRYVPLDAKNRKFIGKNWDKSTLRAVQALTVGRHGSVTPRPRYFYDIYGRDLEEYMKICKMPEDWIIRRGQYRAEVNEYLGREAGS